MKTQLAIQQRVRITSKEEFEDWLAGQQAAAETTRFLHAVYDPRGWKTAHAYYAVDDQSQLLVRGQSYVWVAV